jgi:hypothetical protein
MNDFSLVGSILGSSFLGAVIGSVLKGVWDRRLAKRVPKTDRRAEAYKDFATYFIAHINVGANDRLKIAAPNLNEIKARLVVFGESEVVCEAANFLSEHQSLNTEKARQDFCKVIKAMRESVRTGAGVDVMQNILKLLAPAK